MKYFIIWILIGVLFISLYNSKELFDNMDSIDIDIVYYINLDHRSDRKTNFLTQMDQVGFSRIQRIPGILEERGHIGCTKSHIKTLKTFIQSGAKNCIIFEDDFEWLGSPIKALSDFFKHKIPYDICMLSGAYGNYETTKWPFLRKISNAQTASGYMIQRDFAPTLLKNFEEGLRLLEQPEYDHSKYALDQYWKILQPTSRWYIFNPKLGKQISSVSDIQGGYVNMNT
jgi:GR25 family glycosyltransferase involved in LPS biosynthesis